MRGSLALAALVATVFLIFCGSGEPARAQVSQASGATYYVSPDGSDSAAGTHAAVQDDPEGREPGRTR